MTFARLTVLTTLFLPLIANSGILNAQPTRSIPEPATAQDMKHGDSNIVEKLERGQLLAPSDIQRTQEIIESLNEKKTLSHDEKRILQIITE